MKRFGMGMLVVLLFCAGFGQMAQAADFKIAVVDLQRALLEVEEGKQAKESFRKIVVQKQKVVNEMETRLTRLKDEMEKQGMMLSPDAKAKKEEELQKEFMEYQKMAMDLQTQLKQQETEAVAPIYEKMQLVLQKISEKNGYGLILDKTTVAYSPLKYDVTNELVRMYDEMYSGKKKRK